MRILRFIGATAICAVAGSALAQVNPGEVVINEVQIVESGTDANEYVELYNKTGAPIDISGLTLHHINGAAGATIRSVTFPALTTIPANDYYVIGSATVPNVDFTPTIANATPTA